MDNYGIVSMFRIEIIDGVATMVPRDAPARFTSNEDTIVLRPNKPLKVIPPPEAEPEVELEIEEMPYIPDEDEEEDTQSESESEDESESEGEEPQYGVWQPDTSCFIPEIKPEPESERPLDLDLWRLGLRNDVAEFVIKFHNERLEKCDDTIKTTASEIVSIFNEWKDDREKEDKVPDPNMNYNRILWDFLSGRYGGKKQSKTVFWGVRLNLTEEELEQKEAKERARREMEELIARDKEEREMPRIIIPDTLIDTKPIKKKAELLDVFKWGDVTIHRHPEYPRYGGDLTTGEIFKLKGNTVERLMNCRYEKGVRLEAGLDEDGKRIQKSKSAQIFIADCGKLKGATKFHTKLKINTAIAKPFVRFYPLACLSYEYDGGVEFGGDLNREVIKSGNSLVSRCKTTKEINDYVAGVKIAYEDKRRNDLTEIARLKGENVKLKAQNAKLEKENKQLNTPLNAGAVQLREVLLTKLADGSTVLEMLHLANKDITYGCITDDDERSDAETDFGLIFEMSPRGLPDRNEIITR